MDDQALIDRLRSDLVAERSATPVPDALGVRSHRRWQQRRTRRYRAGAAAVALVLVGGAALAATRGDDATVSTRRWASAGTPRTTTVPEGPSQTPEDAVRDGVPAQIAALPVSERMTSLASSDAPPEGRYVISQPLEAQPTIPSYAEVVLLDGDDRIVKAFPMPELPPTWIHVSAEEVFGGRMAQVRSDDSRDPGNPESTIFRIDRRTLELTVYVFPGPDGIPPRTGAPYLPAPEEVDPDDLAWVVPSPEGDQAAATVRYVSVDRNGLRGLFGLPPYENAF